MAKEKTPLQKTDWTSSFNLIGRPKFTEYTYKIDERSKNSDWVYNAVNLGIDAGEKHGVVYCELSGGYGAERTNNVIYVHGKDDNGKDDFKKQFTVDWNDRFEDSVLEEVGEMCFYKVGLEKDTHNDLVIKKFLSPYDMIAYINEVLTEDMIVRVTGQLRYTMYNGNLQCRKEIKNMYLQTKAEESDFTATFVQTMLIDKDSAGKDTIDQDKKVMYVYAYLLEKFKEFNGWDLTEDGKVKGGICVPLKKTFEFDLNGKEPKTTAALINKVFKVKKGITQMTMDGEFVESGATVKVTYDDLTDDIKYYVDNGIYKLEDAIAACSGNGSKERRMLVTRPHIKLVGEEGDKTPVIQITPEVYEEEDLLLDCLVPKEDSEEELPFDEVDTESNAEVDDLAALLASM